ncbi:MAG: nucleotidyltransferase family protein [Candidatus Competibacteraceae bacterium]
MQAYSTPIQRTLLQLLRRPDESRTQPAPVGLNPAEWEALRTEAGRQDVMPLLYYRLQSRPERTAIPTSILASLQHAFLKNTAYIALLYHELRQILSACEQEGIPVILLKGSYLAKQVYPEPGLRPMRDMDLMVRPWDLARAGAVSEKLGYALNHPYNIEVETAVSRDIPTYKKRGVFGIEWHWRLSDPGDPLTFEPDELWERAVPMRVEGVSCFGLAPEDLLLHLAFHLAGHHLCSVPLRFLVDIDIVLGADSQRLDWQVLIDRARRWHWERCVYLTLRLATECFGTPLPERVLTTLVPEPVEDEVMGWAYEQLFAGPVPKPQRMTTNLVQVWKQPGLVQRLRLLWAKVFTSPLAMSREFGVHPDSLALWRYYPLRLWILMQRYGRQVLRLWWQDPAQRAVLERYSNRNALERWLER